MTIIEAALLCKSGQSIRRKSGQNILRFGAADGELYATALRHPMLTRADMLADDWIVF